MRVFAMCLTALGVTQSLLQAQPPVITNQPASRAMWAGGNATFAVGVSGAGPFTYQWQLNSTNLPNSIISTVAGTNPPSYFGDGVFATSADLNKPQGVALDAFGNFFFADQNNQRVRKINTNGIITTVAGNGTTNYSGDGGAAISASLHGPSGVAVDAFGNLFIADSFNNRIRKVNTNGIITTVAGNGSSSYSGDGGAASNAGVAPADVVVDASGNLFIADQHNSLIRKVDTSGIIMTVAGNGTSGFSGDGGAATNASLNFPSALALDSSGNLFIADFLNNRIRQVSTLGVISTVAGSGPFTYSPVSSGDGGPATNATFALPYGVTLDAFGNLFFSDNNGRIRKVNSNGIITTVAGNGSGVLDAGDGGAATNASLVSPGGVAVNASGNLFIAETGDQRIRKVDTNGVITTFAGGGIGDGAPAINASLSYPAGVAVDAAGNLFIADDGNNIIRQVNTNGSITTIAGRGGFGTYSGDGGPAIKANLGGPFRVTLDTSGNLFIADAGNDRLREITANGIITTVAGNGTSAYSGDGGPATNAACTPVSATADAFGNLFIVDTYNQRIRKVDSNGIITTVAGNGTDAFSGDGGAAISASLSYPYDVAIDSVGNLLIAERGNNRIRKVDSSGIITTIAGNGATNLNGQGIYSGDGGAATNAGLFGPSGVALDASGNVFITDTFNQRIRKVSTNGIITTVAGNGSGSGNGGYLGDGGPATSANLFNPECVAVDAFGNLFIADQYNKRIRKVTNTQGPGLTLNNVSAANSGYYQVMVTGPGGSVTSSVATLTVATVPLIYRTALNPDGSVTLSLLSQPNSTNIVFSATSLLPPVIWQPLSTNLARPDGNWQYTDTNAPNYQTRFYQSLTL
jgi:sugar lactone lactonase YvrE